MTKEKCAYLGVKWFYWLLEYIIWFFFFKLERNLPMASYSQILESILENVMEAKIKEEWGRDTER